MWNIGNKLKKLILYYKYNSSQSYVNFKCGIKVPWAKGERVIEGRQKRFDDRFD